MTIAFKPTGYAFRHSYSFHPAPPPAPTSTWEPEGEPDRPLADRLPKSVLSRLESFDRAKPRFEPFPTVGDGMPELALAASSLRWSDHQDRFRQGHTVTLYQAVSDGLCQLAAEIRAGLVKFGLTANADPRLRMDRLCIDRYGSLHADESGELVEAAGFDSWRVNAWPKECVETVSGPVSWSARGLLIELPETLPFAAFESALQRAFAPAELFAFAGSGHGERHIAHREVAVTQAQRYTAYVRAGDYTLERSQEIYLFSRNMEKSVVRVVENIVAAHLLQRAW